jgi:hypothetical protein
MGLPYTVEPYLWCLVNYFHPFDLCAQSSMPRPCMARGSKAHRHGAYFFASVAIFLGLAKGASKSAHRYQ